MGLRTVILIFLMLPGIACSQEHSETATVDSVQQIIDEALVRSRSAIDKFGTTDSAFIAMQNILSDLALIPHIKTRGKMKELHGNSSMSRAMLASESDSGISLYLSWFGKGASTPIHDHLTWGVIRVLEGKDKYTHWKRATDNASGETVVIKTNEQIIKAGESVYWLGPPDDIHSQQAVDGEVWEMVMTGRDLSSAYVNQNQQRFDAKTGRMIPKKSK